MKALLKPEVHEAEKDKAVAKSVSLPASVIATAQQRADELGRSFSNYLRLLIQRDCETAKPEEVSK